MKKKFNRALVQYSNYVTTCIVGLTGAFYNRVKTLRFTYCPLPRMKHCSILTPAFYHVIIYAKRHYPCPDYNVTLRRRSCDVGVTTQTVSYTG